MTPQPPIPAPLWNTVPPEAQVAILALFDSLNGRVAELEQRVGDLEARLKLNSTNSSKPPSSDPIGFNLFFDSCALVFDVTPLVMGRGSYRSHNPGAAPLPDPP